MWSVRWMLILLVGILGMINSTVGCDVTDGFNTRLEDTGLTLNDVMQFTETELDELMRDEFEMKISQRHTIKKWLRTFTEKVISEVVENVSETGSNLNEEIKSPAQPASNPLTQWIMQAVGGLIISSFIISIELYRRKYASETINGSEEKISNPSVEPTVIRMQAIRRGSKCRKVTSKLLQESRCAIQIQKHARSFLAKRFVNKLTHVIRLQTLRRGVLAKRIHHDLIMRTNAAMIIQKVMRSHLSLLHNQKKQKSVITLQRWWRMHHDNLISSYNTILSFIKTASFRVRIARCIKKRIAARILIQSTIRGFLSRKQHQSTLKRRRSASLLIMGAVKNHLNRENRSQTTVTTNAAVIIQKAIRKLLKSNKRVSASITIQRAVRKHLSHTATVRSDAAIVIQRAFRTEAVEKTKRLEAALLLQSKREMMAVRIQKHIRGFLSRKRVKTLQSLRSVRILQRSVRLMLYKNKRIAACIKIQKATRSMITLKSIANRKLTQSNQQSACVIIQKATRCMIARKLVSSKLLQRASACVAIQKVFRGLQVRKMFSSTIRSVGVVQKVFRGNKVRKLLADELLKKTTAVIRIQRYVKKWLKETEIVTITAVRPLPSVAIQFAQQHAASVAIQRFVRERLIEPKVTAVNVIQSFVRSRQQVKKFFLMKEACNNAATVIQRLARQFFSRKILCKKSKELHCCVIIQRAVRSKITIRTRMAKLIQSNVRLWISKRFQLKSAIVIQSAVRMFLVKNIFKKQISSVILIQRLVKNHQHAKATMIKHSQEKAAIIIQSNFKMLLSRIRYSNTLKAISVFQRICRGFACKNLYKKQRQSCVTIQKNYRRWSQTMKYNKAVLQIIRCQSHVRSYLSRGCVNNIRESNIKVQKATLIQSHFRKMINRKQYNSLRSAVLIIQTHTKGWICRTRFSLIKKSVTTIQSTFRMQIAIRRKNALLTSCVVLQGLGRIIVAKNIKNKLSKQRNASITIQRNTRGFFGRRKSAKLLTAYIKIQSLWRCVLAKRVSAKLLLKKKSTRSFSNADLKTKAKHRKLLVDEKRCRDEIQQLGLNELKGKISDEKRRRKSCAVESRVEEEKKRRFFSKATSAKNSKRKPTSKPSSTTTTVPISRRRKAAPTVVQLAVSPQSARTEEACLDPVPDLTPLPVNHTPHREVCDITLESDLDTDSDSNSVEEVKQMLPSVAAITIQKMARVHFSRKQHQHLKLRKQSATVIQKITRGYLTRRSKHSQGNSEEFLSNVMIELDFSDDDQRSEYIDSPLIQPADNCSFDSITVEGTTTIAQLRASRCPVEKFGSMILRTTEITDTESEMTECSTPGCIELSLPESPTRMSFVEDFRTLAEVLPDDSTDFEPRLSVLSRSVGRMSIGTLADMLNDIPPGTPRDSNQIVNAVLECITPRDQKSSSPGIDLETAIATGDVNCVIACLSSVKDSSLSPRHM